MSRKIDNIVIHCTAGYGNVDSIKKYWKNVLKWKSVGYHIIVDLDGELHFIADFDTVVNGVANNNSKSIHISYIGGVLKDDYTKSSDTRTEKQKEGLKEAILKAREYAPKARILGHRDFSPDKNKNGKIDINERIKECPSFEVKDWIKEWM
jgi:N-acetylmuramoyl-L-alanine amidase